MYHSFDILEPAVVACLGFGWDSARMLIEMVRRGQRVDLITFADVGAEKQGTYDFIPVFSQYLVDHDYPKPRICRYKPKAQTHTRYRDAVLEAQRHLGIELSTEEIDRLSGIYGNMIANDTLPSQAFGMKGCSLKWKVEAQEPIRIRETALRRTWASGQKVIKLIGFDANETHRTFADNKGGTNICPDADIPHFRDRYEVRYPLREWGFTREECGRGIVAAGLPLPPKSACFFCPAMRKDEIDSLRREEPALYQLALYMEQRYRGGRHFRGDEYMKITARHKDTGERFEWECFAPSKAVARSMFRFHIKDSRPYKWQVSVSTATVGLGRNFAWEQTAFAA